MIRVVDKDWKPTTHAYVAMVDETITVCPLANVTITVFETGYDTGGSGGFHSWREYRVSVGSGFHVLTLAMEAAEFEAMKAALPRANTGVFPTPGGAR